MTRYHVMIVDSVWKFIEYTKIAHIIKDLYVKCEPWTAIILAEMCTLMKLLMDLQELNSQY